MGKRDTDLEKGYILNNSFLLLGLSHEKKFVDIQRVSCGKKNEIKSSSWVKKCEMKDVITFFFPQDTLHTV